MVVHAALQLSENVHQARADEAPVQAQERPVFEGFPDPPGSEAPARLRAERCKSGGWAAALEAACRSRSGRVRD